MRGSVSLLDEILSEFGLQNTGAERALHDLCLRESQSGRLCWLLIDDAQHLSELEIRLLSRLREICGESLHLALFGPPSLEKELSRRMPEGVAVHTLTLYPLSGDEVRAYVEYRFRTAGGVNGVPLSDPEYQMLAQQSRGSLVKLHTLAIDRLIETVQRGPAPMAGLPRSHLVLVLLMIVAVAALYLTNEEGGKGNDDEPIPSISLDRQRIEVLPMGSADSHVAAALPTDVPAQKLAPAKPAVLSPDPAPLKSASETTGEDVEALNSQDKPEPRVSQPAVSAKPPAKEPKERPSPQQKDRFEYDSEGRRGGEPDADETYLMRLPPSSWTVQLMGSHDPATTVSFRQQYRLDTKQYRKLRNGKEWYVVVYGGYASRDEADRAVAALPSRLQRMLPWVRAVADIQREIRAARAIP